MAIITVRSYEIGQEGAGGESFEALLDRIFQLENSKRIKPLTDDYIVWLSRYERPNNGDIVSGEFVRVRDKNFPIVITDQGQGIDSLPLTHENIGQGAAFRYKISKNLFYMQYDARIVSTGRAMAYLSEFTTKNKFIAKVRVNPKVWEDLEEGHVKDLQIGIASFDNFGPTSRDSGSMVASFGKLSEAHNTPSMSIKIGMGQNKGKIDDSVKEEITEVLQLQEDGHIKVKTIRVKVQGATDEAARNINMLNDILSKKIDIGFPKNDPEENYRRRAEFLKALMDNDEL